MLDGLRQKIDGLYTGRDRRAVTFRYALIVFDAVTILFFIVTAPIALTPAMAWFDVVLGLAILADLLARLWIAPDRKKMLRQIYTLADIVVIFSLLLAPVFADDLAFLRILRGLRLIHSYHLLRDLRRDSQFFRRNEDTVLAFINLFVFVFVTASVVFVVFFDRTAGAAAYIDALYFTVASLTTTGYGDIVPDTTTGKLISVVVMVVGVALFVQLARAIIQPSKVRYKCPSCGLLRHDIDAVHCKHCGEPLKIETKGAE